MWIKCSERKPPVGKLVNTKIDDERGARNHAKLKFERNLWWDGDMYIYYTPTHWEVE